MNDYKKLIDKDIRELGVRMENFQKEFADYKVMKKHTDTIGKYLKTRLNFLTQEIDALKEILEEQD